tara:strand:- start:889 stop:1089 length:201 start_codon:yes stop_codon:yes gene_type:complete
MPLKTLLEYQLSSGGSVNIPIETIRQYVLDEVQSTESHKAICRVFEIMTGLRTDSTDEQDIKRITR